MADRVAYLLKGYPRVSELFIASEIHRLETHGVSLNLYVIKPADEAFHHPVVDRIRAVPRRLPPVSSLSKQPLHRWLRANYRPFMPGLRSALRRHPRGLVLAGFEATCQSIRARKGYWPRKIYVKEFLQALAFVDLVEADGGADLIHAHFAHGTTTVAWFASMILGVPFSFTAHAKDIYEPSLNPAGLLARKMRAAAFVTTCTGANHAHLQTIEPDADVRLIYHGLNADFATLLNRPLPETGHTATANPERVSAATLEIISVGRQVPKKGFDVLIDATALLVERGLDARLTIAGEDGPEHPRLMAQLTRLRLGDRVRFAGTVTQSELFDLYRSSTVFALACRIDGNGDRDGIPNVLVEAMASGLPVVSTDVSGIPEVLTDGETGRLVPPEDAEALADAIWRIAKDPAEAVRLGQAGADLIKTRFDGDRLARSLAALFEQVEP